MKTAILVFVMILMAGSLLIADDDTEVSADENYNDHSQEISPGPGDSPDEGQARVEPRTRNKDA